MTKIANQNAVRTRDLIGRLNGMKDGSKLLPLQLMAKPALSFEEFWIDLLGIPESTAEELTKSTDGPKFFLIGRRRYIRQKDALAWIDAMAESHPYFPRRNNKLP